ncbi:MAG: hypothetical protein KDJ64_05015, partial [Nitratireductor sp.]|nr:hypothetical protein [Nitratireductor sp.]
MTKRFHNPLHSYPHSHPQNRRAFLLGAASAGAALSQFPLPGIITPALAGGFAPTQSMRGGANNYRPNAPLV